MTLRNALDRPLISHNLRTSHPSLVSSLTGYEYQCRSNPRRSPRQPRLGHGQGLYFDLSMENPATKVFFLKATIARLLILGITL